ncbi:hypothetical protein [Trichococcus collinsii]|nr:hypothetical protein [Trichococcus collinsii]
MDMRKQDGITLIEKIATTSNLVVVCEKVYKNKGAAGLDGITVYEIDEHMAKYQKAIIAKLLDGTYEPQPFKRVSISKGNGSMRNLGIPVVRDRVVQQAILQIIEPPCTEPYAWWCDRSEPVGSSYSIVPGRGGINWLVLYDYLD